jgi:predicted acetyltransferase
VIRLARPGRELLPGYVAALEAGWAPSNIGGERLRLAHLAAIAEDADAFLESLHDPEAKGPPIVLEDGTAVPRLPGWTRWIDDGSFAGFVNVRWQAGTEALPPHVSGHLGYGMIPEKRGRGLATAALGLALGEVRALGLRHVVLTADPSNAASVRVIERNGGVAVGRGVEPAAHGGREIIRFRIAL